MIAYRVLLLSFLCFNSYAQHSKNPEDYTVEFGPNNTVSYFRKEQVTLPDGRTFTHLVPIKKLPKQLHIEKEGFLEFYNKMFNKYAWPITSTLAVVGVFYLAKGDEQQQSNTKQACIAFLQGTAVSRLGSTALSLYDDINRPHVKVAKNPNVDSQQKAAQFFQKSQLQ